MSIAPNSGRHPTLKYSILEAQNRYAAYSHRAKVYTYYFTYERQYKKTLTVLVFLYYDTLLEA